MKLTQKERETLNALIPDKLVSEGWAIGRLGPYPTFSEPWGRIYLLHGSTLEQVADELKKWIFLLS